MIVVKRLIWEQTNINHIARHEVTPQEVEEVCRNKPVILTGHSGRVVAIGYTNQNRPVSVILHPKFPLGTYYPVTARTTDKKERKHYQEQKKGNI